MWPERKRSLEESAKIGGELEVLSYPSLELVSSVATQPGQQQLCNAAGNHSSCIATASVSQQQYDDGDGLLDSFGDIPTDAEASIMLLRNQLYPDPAAAAATAAAARSTRSAKRSRGAPGPSKATAAVVTAAAAAATAAWQVPPIILKSQLYTVLVDRTAVDKEVEDLRQRGKLKLFKLAIGADEFVVLLISDYLQLLDDLVAKHNQQAQQLQEQASDNLQRQQRHHAASQQEVSTLSTAFDGHDDAISSTEHSAVAATIQLFRSRVIPVCRESHITSAQLLKHMQSAAQPSAKSGMGLAAAVPAVLKQNADDILRRLLSAELVCRDTHVQNSYKFTVPGAASFVKSVVAGRQEMLRALQRKKYQEVLEKELMCVSLRGSCLTPAFHLRDLQGRGLVTCSDTTAGKLVRLVKRK